MSNKTKTNIFSIAQLLIIIVQVFESSKLISTAWLDVMGFISTSILLGLAIENCITKSYTKRQLIVSSLVLVLTTVLAFTSNRPTIVMIGLVIFAARDINIDKLIFRDFIFRCIACSVLFSLIAYNAQPDYWQLERIPFGFGHPNTMGGMLMVIGIEVLYINKNNKDLLPFIFVILLMVFNLLTCKSRTSFGILGISLVFFGLMKLNINLIKNKIGSFFIKNSFIIFTVFSIILVYLYSSGTSYGAQLNAWFSNRLMLSLSYIKEYGLSLLGKPISVFEEGFISESGNSLFCLDMSFIDNLMTFGFVGVIYLAFLFYVTFSKLIKKQNYYLILAMLLMLLYGFMEVGSFIYNVNIFLVALSLGVFYKKEDEEEFYLNKYFVVSLATLIVCLFFLRGYMINNNSQFIINGNFATYDQYKYLVAFKNNFLNFSKFNWSLGLGSNAFELYAKGLYSPFNLITLLIKNSFVPYAVLYINIFKLVVCGLGMVLWLSKVYKNRNLIVGLSLVLTFSSLALTNYGTNYLDYYCLLPFALYFVDESKYLGTIVSIFILLLSCPTLLIQTLLFFIIYGLYRSLIKHDNPIKNVIAVIAAVGMTSFVTIPILFLNNANDANVIGNLLSLITPIEEYSNSPILTYTSVGICALLISSLTKKKETTSIITLLVTLAFAIILGDFSYFMLILIASIMLNEDYANKTLIIVYEVITSILIINFVLVNSKLNGSSSIFELLYIVLLVICLILFVKENKKAINFVLALELVISIISFLSINNTSIWEDEIFKFSFIDTTISDSIKKKDNGFFRVIDGEAGYKYLDRTEDSFSLKYNNTNLVRNVAGISINNSLFNEESKEFIDLINQPMDESYVGYDKNYTSYYNLAGSKYWFDDGGNYVPPTYYEKVANEDYYQNKYFIELGYVNNNLINSDFVRTLNNFDKERVLREYIVTDVSDNQNYVLSDNIEYITTSYYGGIDYWFDESISDKTITIINGGIRIVDVELLYNDILVKTQHFDQYNYCNVEIDSTESVNRVVVKYDDVDETNNALSLYVTETESKIQEKLYNERVNNSFKNIKFNDDYIAGDIDINEDDSFVYTYIPYDKNWHINDNGNPVEIIKANYGFIGFRLNSGQHHVEFNYVPEGVNVGNTLSIASTVLAVVFMIISKKK